ncbi:MAG: ribosome maturation factor RimM [Gemmatimonadaceae bacterium]
MAPAYALVGRVRRAHGIRGELVVEMITDDPDAVFAIGSRVFVGDADGRPGVDRTSGEPETALITHVRPFKAGRLVTVDGVNDRNGAEGWRGLFFMVPFAELTPPAEGQLDLHDLPGMLVRLTDGTDVGPIRDVYELPQGLVVEVEHAGATVMLPYTERTLRAVDRQGRVVVLELPAGLLEASG